MKKIFIFSVIACILLSMSVYAENEIKAFVDSDTQVVTVSGNIGSVDAGKRVMITVLSKGLTAVDMAGLTNENIKQNVIGLYMGYANPDGEYQVNFKLNSESGEYTAVVSGYEKQKNFSTVFFKPGDVKSILEKLETARKNKDSGAMKNILSVEDNLRSIGIGKFTDETYGVKFTDLGISSFENLANYEEKYDLAATFLNAYHKVCVIKAFNTIETQNSVATLIGECEDILQIMDTKAYKFYNLLEDTSSIDAIVQNGGYGSIDDIVTTFCDSVYLLKIDSMENWSEFADFLDDNNDYLKIDVTAYKKLKYPSEVDKKIAGNSYGNVESLKRAFKNAVDEQKETETYSKSNSSSSGGKGSSSSKISSYTAPIVIPQQPTVPVLPSVKFSDIESVSWAEEAINSLATKKILSGKEEGKFYPNDIVTREEIAKIIVEAFNIDKNGATCDFDDVDKNHWSYKYVAAANKSGVINGYNNMSFGLGNGLTRQDIATIIYRVAKANGIQLVDAKKIEFVDGEEIADYAKDAVEALSSAGIINGKGESTFAPYDYCTRAEAAKMIYSVLNVK